LNNSLESFNKTKKQKTIKINQFFLSNEEELNKTIKKQKNLLLKKISSEIKRTQNKTNPNKFYSKDEITKNVKFDFRVFGKNLK
jgi:hypothetical protein